MARPNKSWLRHHKKITIAVVIISLASLVFSPAGLIKDKIIDTIPALALSMLITEGLFIAGIVIMALVAGFDLGPNPFKWRDHLQTLGQQINKSKMFWVGFWVNTIGALGSGLVLGYGIVKALPTSSWGLLWIPVLDIILTFSVRAAVLDLHRAAILTGPIRRSKS